MSGTRTALLTGAWGPAQELAEIVARHLGAEGWHIRSAAPHRSDAGHWADHHVGDLRSPEFIEALLTDLPGGGAHAIVIHLAPLVAVADAAIAHSGNPAEALDIATRGTYRLLMGCLSAGVGRVVQTSSLSSFDAYEDGLEVTEQWRPRPGPNADDLAPYLSELTAREFTRDPLVNTPLEVTQCGRWMRRGRSALRSRRRPLATADRTEATAGGSFMLLRGHPRLVTPRRLLTK
ncbi:MAG: NAD(P)-dependent oxidoreductase [Chloroflexi bacterium]|nr:NAD(P)-dependent oxidoreductase [Chloroflexota bacterium]